MISVAKCTSPRSLPVMVISYNDLPELKDLDNNKNLKPIITTIPMKIIAKRILNFVILFFLRPYKGNEKNVTTKFF
jgi:hypothetical protein